MSRQRLTPAAPHPALIRHAQERAEYVQNRIADRITAYAGSMHFVYLHIALFAVWMFLRQILELTDAIHRLTVAHTGKETGRMQAGTGP